MDFVVIAIAASIGLIIGAIISRFVTLRQFNHDKLQQELQLSKSQLHQYRQDVSTHLETTNQLMTQLQDNYGRIARHIAESKMQLVAQPTAKPDDDELNYLSGDIASHIRQSIDQIDEKRRVYSDTVQQPRDYSGQSSGLIKQKVTDQNNN
ncbi:YhcB family protein [Rheinheimera sp. MMS21-TC3]|uniref:YhcB family protein n=1 Tax=Rheinheimera sp. MMS21-TC3 TaxID=3072790 RepID=UPI0028C484FC|nr:YhcB family protein [Rheinheimera sp. MMS21-TC3]WNO62165.1 YhcB family protein [Rheinheimera sp. MMS21-TC3]